LIPLSDFKSLFFVFSIILLTACNASKKAQKGAEATDLPEMEVDSLLEKLSSNQVAVEWVNAKAKFTFKDDTQTRKFTATIRLRKDSVLWMVVKKLSVEAARVLVDKDSVYVLDRLNKEYYIKSLDYLAEEYHLPADFDALQTMLLGNPYLMEDQKLTVKSQGNQYQLTGEEEGGLLNDYWINGTTFALERMSFLDLRYERKLDIALEDHELQSEGFIFSNKRMFKMASAKTGAVEVSFNIVESEFNVPKRMPFSISSRYKRVD